MIVAEFPNDRPGTAPKSDATSPFKFARGTNRETPGAMVENQPRLSCAPIVEDILIQIQPKSRRLVRALCPNHGARLYWGIRESAAAYPDYCRLQFARIAYSLRLSGF